MNDKQARRPIIDPLILMFKSRRVLVAISALFVGLMTILVPELEAIRNELMTLVISLALALIGGYSVEDAAANARQQMPPDDLKDQIREVVDSVLEEMPMSQ